jgi:hypothetical protein
MNDKSIDRLELIGSYQVGKDIIKLVKELVTPS